MTGRVQGKKSRNLALAAVTTLVAATVIACGPEYYEIPIETPIQPKLDVTAFQRVLVAGFVAGGTEDVDTNQETVRLLRSQLRTKSSLKVIDADVMALIEVAQDQSKAANADESPAGAPAANSGASGSTANGNGATPGTPAGANGATHTASQVMALPMLIKDEKDLESYERLFANTSYWKRIGEEYQNPLIVTGTVLFKPQTTSGFVQREIEQMDGYGRRRVVPTRTYMERKGFTLAPKFIFIDGRTGATLYRESYKEQILYNAQQNTPALSSYFELMDRLLPSFLSALSNQKIRGTRVLLR